MSDDIDTPPLYAELAGETFLLNGSPGSMPFMRFALVSKQHANAQRAGQALTSDQQLEGLLAMFSILKAVVHPDDWDRFEQHATDIDATDEQLLEFVGEAGAARSSRPRVRSSDSSDGPQTTDTPSTVSSSEPDIDPVDRVREDMSRRGRGDLALIVNKAQRARRAS